MIELKDLSDEELEKKIRISGVVRRYPGLQDWVLELLERYNNKKNECDELQKKYDRFKGDSKMLLDFLRK